MYSVFKPAKQSDIVINVNVVREVFSDRVWMNENTKKQHWSCNTRLGAMYLESWHIVPLLLSSFYYFSLDPTNCRDLYSNCVLLSVTSWGSKYLMTNLSSILARYWLYLCWRMHSLKVLKVCVRAQKSRFNLGLR